ncbi:MAG: hypothetical protein EBX40_00220 [Gammaproteobacteria bacterium]|nr:hypothetical protein [Gammaproteobacteria bacterium]
MSVINGQLANASTFNAAFVSKTADSTTSGVLTQDKESVLKEIATPATPSSGYGKIYFKADGKLYQLNDAGIETQVGTGSGSGGGTNFITNGSASDNNTTGWGTYADAAGASPVDGAGGTPNVTISTSASSPLIGTYSFLMVKDAVNRQGQGWEYDFTIDSAYKAKVLQIDFEYLVSSGTFTAGTSSADSDVTVWIYDVTNSVVIQPSAYKLLSNSSTLSTRHSATFQSASNSTSYRLIFHVSTTSASAYTLKVDGISVSPEQYVYGTPVTDWQAYTPTFTGFGTVSTQTFWWRRNGDTIQIKGRFAAGTSTATEARISLPFSLVSDSSKVNGTAEVCGIAQPSDVNSSTTGGIGATFNVLIEPSLGYVTFAARTSTNGGLTKLNANTIATGGTSLSLFAQLPVTGWSSSVQTSDASDTRIVDFVGYVSTNQGPLTANTTNINLATIKDSHGAWTGSTFVVPVAGDYFISGMMVQTASTSGIINIYVNGSSTAILGNFLSTQTLFGSGTLLPNLKTGDVVSFRSDSTNTIQGPNLTYRVCISRLSGPSAIAASETVASKYWASANGTSNTSTPVNFDSKVYDTHSAVTTGASWRFTAPISGKYSIKVFMANSAAITSGYTYIYKNGTQLEGMNYIVSTTASMSSSSTVELNAGEYFDIRQGASYPWLGNASRSGGGCFIEIERVGN